MNAQTANAYYGPLNDEIVFPTSILQSPFFDHRADRASNFGAIGFVVTHQTTHGIDLSRSKFESAATRRTVAPKATASDSES